MKNEARDFTWLFKTGDAVDLQFGSAKTVRQEPGAGDNRLVLSVLDGKPVAILLRPVDPSAPKSLAKTYVSPVGSKHFDRVERLDNVQLALEVVEGGYTMTAAVPLAEFGIEPSPGLKLRGDVGFISSDGSGKRNIARTYWANPGTALVSDEPIEAWLFPASWGQLILE